MRIVRELRLMVAALCLLGCKQDNPTVEPRPPIPPVHPTAPAPVPSPPQQRLPSLAAFADRLPTGWRDLRFGMSEREVGSFIKKYRQDFENDMKKRFGSWTNHTRLERQKGISVAIPFLLPPLAHVVTVGLDGKRFSEYSISQIDDGASEASIWFDTGKFIGLRIEGNADLPVADFVKQASGAYVAQPRSFNALFLDTSTGFFGANAPTTNHDVWFWRGNGTTALIWEGSHPCGMEAGQLKLCPHPVLLVLSDAAVEEAGKIIEARQTSHQASADQAKSQVQSATKF